MVLGIASANLIDAVSWFLSRLHSTTGAEALPLKPEEIPVSLILLNWLPLITGTLVVTVAALILWGKDWPLRLRDCLRGARWQDFAIAIGAAVAIHLVARTISYGLLRGALGISEDFRISAVFGLPRWRSLAFFLPALLEEIGWRAYFQTHLIRRFGIRRGLILVGVAWGAWHLQGDLASSTTLAGTALVVFARLINTTVMAGVFGWLYLRSGSVLPVTFLHFGLNVLASTPFFGYPLPIYFSFILTLPPAIALAWYLFSVYPPTETQPPEPPLEKAEGAGA